VLRQAWVGVDVGKGHHHAVVIDEHGNRLLSRRVANDEAALVSLLGDALALADRVTWAIDISTGGAALLLALLVAHEQQVLYISSTMVNRAAGGYRGEGKTDARDAAVIADQARMRRGLTVLRTDEESVVELRMLVARRQDLVGDRTRAVNRLRELLLSLCPALERALDLGNKGPLVLLTEYQRSAVIRALSEHELRGWLRDHRVRGAAKLAADVVRACESQATSLPGEEMAAVLIAQLVQGLRGLNDQVREIDTLIEDRFRGHELAEVIESMPGIGCLLGAEFLAATGGDSIFPSAGHLAGNSGLAPTPHDSGRVSGNLHRPRRYNRALNRVFYTSALVSVQHNPESRVFYDRKRAEGKRHTQAVLALARGRVNVLWALIRDRRCYQPMPPTPPTIQAA
jgi:transposase